MLTFRSLFDDNREPLKLEWLAGRSSQDQRIDTPLNGNVYSADIVGHLNLIHPHRIHILGQPEVEYYARVDASRRKRYADELMNAGPLGLIVTGGMDFPPEFLDVAEAGGLPCFRSPLPAAEVIEILRNYLAKSLAARCTLHGVYMDVLGMGVLVAGDSGVGKSELGLELISRGHGLVADDVVDISRVAPDTLEGRCPPLLANLLEVRGLGLLDIKAIFGETAVRRKMKLRLIVELKRYGATETVERLPLEGQSEEILGVAVRKVVIPVASGRNLAVLTEAAVRNTILQLRGVDTMREFLQRQQQQMSRS